MPLKHVTETWLAVTLACVTALTGFLMSTLPPLPAGTLPWLLLFAFAIAYPVLLTPLFRKNRADSVFRWLHWAPAALLTLWLAAALISFFTQNPAALRALTWGWSLPAVAMVLLALALFCVQVLRRWLSRLALIGLVLLAFATGGLLSESGFHPERAVTAFLWTRFSGENGLIGWQSSSSASRPASSVPLGSTNLSTAKQDEEELIRQRLSSAAAVAAAQSSAVAQGSSSSKATVVATKPVHLPKAGGEVEAIMLSLMGLGSARYVRRWMGVRIIGA